MKNNRIRLIQSLLATVLWVLCASGNVLAATGAITFTAGPVDLHFEKVDASLPTVANVGQLTFVGLEYRNTTDVDASGTLSAGDTSAIDGVFAVTSITDDTGQVVFGTNLNNTWEMTGSYTGLKDTILPIQIAGSIPFQSSGVGVLSLYVSTDLTKIANRKTGLGYLDGTLVARFLVVDGGGIFKIVSPFDGSRDLQLTKESSLAGFFSPEITGAGFDSNLDADQNKDGVGGNNPAPTSWPFPLGSPALKYPFNYFAEIDGSVRFGQVSCNGSIGDYVWHDLDKDGIQDAAEPGINGVTVNLKDDGGNVVGTTVTANGPGSLPGYYQFVNRCPGNYTVEVDTTTLPPGYFATPSTVGSDRSVDSNGSPAAVSLTTAVPSDQTIDFGFGSPCTGKVGDFVWNDLDRDGVQGAGEPGLDGVTVNIYLGSTLVGTATTGLGPNNVHGYYQFTGLCAGTYTVTAGTPAGFLPTQSLQGGDTAKDSNGSPTTVTLTFDDSVDTTIDFGFVGCLGTIGDFVWNDANNNGIQDVGETGIDGVTLNLFDVAKNKIATTTSGLDDATQLHGEYHFTGLCPGSYSVEVIPPVGFNPSPNLQGGDTAKDSNASPAPVVLTDLSPSDATIDFGFNAPCTGSIGDFVWHDLNRNGIQETGEPGIAGVTVRLRRTSDNVLLSTTTTDVAGAYSFSGLCAGAYTIEALTPAGGFVATPSSAPGSTTANDSNGSPAYSTLTTNNSIDNTIDFGYNLPCNGAIGDFVWNDANRNGIQDAGETGLAGAVLTLNGPGGSKVYTTAADGFYQFTGLCKGDYTVSVAPPAGYLASPTLQGGNTAVDSNVSGATVPLATDNTTDYTIDFGYNLPCSGAIGDFVWNDANRNGIQDAGETGLAGAVVTLIGPGGTKSYTTAAGGFYQFTGLCKGDYTVSVVAPSGYQPSPTLQGGNTTVDSNVSGATVSLPTDNATDYTIDFGYNLPCSGTVGDFVWNDLNQNGIQDAGEPGIAGATLTLNTGATTTTDANGHYLFSGLCAGNYTVTVTTPPAGMTATTSNAPGSTTANDSNGSPASVTLPTDFASDLTIDFGYYKAAAGCTYTIGYWKTHPDKWPVGSLTLGSVTYSEAQLLQVLNTPVRGNGLISLAYQLIAAKLNTAGGASVTGAVGSAIAAADAMIGSLVVPPIGSGYLDPGVSSTLTGTLDTYNNGLAVGGPAHCGESNPGFPPPSSCTGVIGDFVWNDANLTGIQDSKELGISGVTVTLTNLVTGSTQTDITDANGKYLFNGLCAGSYSVAATAPAGYLPTNSEKGTDRSKDSNPNPAQVTLATDASTDLSIDFGFYKQATTCTGSIGDYVWNDINLNGIQDLGEAGIPGVVITLTGNGKTLTTTTDANGRYLFTGLCAATYSVSATTPTAFTPTSGLQGTDRTKDSNQSPSSILLSTNSSSDLTVDFGFYKTPTPKQAMGCTIGYWKNHTDNWPAGFYTYGTFNAAFGTTTLDQLTLLGALKKGGGGLSNLVRQGTAALLNAQDPRIFGYPLSPDDVINAVRSAVQSGNYDTLANQLDTYNNLGCPLN